MCLCTFFVFAHLVLQFLLYAADLVNIGTAMIRIEKNEFLAVLLSTEHYIRIMFPDKGSPGRAFFKDDRLIFKFPLNQ